jgi:hypothetical protein
VIYPLRRDEIEPTRAYPSPFIYRPRIPIWVGVGDGRRKPFFGLLDTGADDTKMTFSQGERLGVTLDRGSPIPFRGVRSPTFGYFGEVVLELRQNDLSYIWPAEVAFLPDPIDPDEEDRARIVLGHTSFFRYFRVTFDFEENQVELEPNGLFAGRPV